MITKDTFLHWSAPILLIIILDYFEIRIPRFCYHGKLSSSGNCRMCPVEIKGSLKPLIACCTLFNKNMVVYTNTDLVRRSREFIMEFLLINHPLDCPICDQAGECDLQDLSLVYGSDDGRFDYDKKAILNKNVGGLISTNMNRCIYCTRCVRYTTELNNVYTFSILGRGGYSEISNYTQSEKESNYIDGNVIDLCPVGALTSKPYSFRNRTRELSSVESIDILDSLCSNIRIDTINNSIERILPKSNDNLNEDWITDKIRFCYDGFKKQRISFPSYKYFFDTKLLFSSTSWFPISFKILLYYNLYSNKYGNNFFTLLSGHSIDVFSLYSVKRFSLLAGITNLNTNTSSNIDFRKYYPFNDSIKSIDSSNLLIFIGANTRIDSPILNLKIRNFKFKFENSMSLCYIGSKISLNYNITHIGIDFESIYKLLFGKSFFCKSVVLSKKISFFLSILIQNIGDFISILELFSLSLIEQNMQYNSLTLFASDVSLYELGVISYYYTRSNFISNGNIKMLYLLGVDYNYLDISSEIWSIYHGHHGNIGVEYANVILPSTTFVENTNLHMNCEGRSLISNIAMTKRRKMINNETIIYNMLNLFTSTCSYNKLFYTFIYFFYKIPFFFTKYKFMQKLLVSITANVNFLKSSRSNSFFTHTRDYYNTDVPTKSSYFIRKLKTRDLNFVYIY